MKSSETSSRMCHSNNYPRGLLQPRRTRGRKKLTMTPMQWLLSLFETMGPRVNIKHLHQGRGQLSTHRSPTSNSRRPNLSSRLQTTLPLRFPTDYERLIEPASSRCTTTVFFRPRENFTSPTGAMCSTADHLRWTQEATQTTRTTLGTTRMPSRGWKTRKSK